MISVSKISKYRIKVHSITIHPTMSSEEVLTGKAKKAKRSEERYKKGKKSKGDNAEAPALPAGLEAIEAENLAPSDSKKKSSKKRKRSGEEDDEAPEKVIEETPAKATGDAPTSAAAEPTAQKKKRRRKNKSVTTTTSTTTDAAGEETAEGAAATEGEKPKNQRFIVFIGNLPFTATTETITAHFASITPTSIRHMTEQGTNKSKGYAFLEFANYDRMKTCLKLFHHSMFDSGVGGERGQRRINVELTAGGGGGGADRKEKLKVKNARLEEQRKTRAETEAKVQKRKEKKGSKDGPAGRSDKGPAEEKVEAAKAEAPTEGIHPARLAMLNKKW